MIRPGQRCSLRHGVVALTAVLVWMTPACARLGFDISSDRSSGPGPLSESGAPLDRQQVEVDGLNREAGTADARPNAERGPTSDNGPMTDSWPVAPVTRANDDCAHAQLIDLATLTAHHPVRFTVDTNGAARNYASAMCTSEPDVIVRVINSPGVARVSCDGSGNYCFMRPMSPSTICPPSGFGTGATCPGLLTSTPGMPTGTFYLVIWRDPSLGPATFSFLLQ